MKQEILSIKNYVTTNEEINNLFLMGLAGQLEVADIEIFELKGFQGGSIQNE